MGITSLDLFWCYLESLPKPPQRNEDFHKTGKKLERPEKPELKAKLRY